MANELWTPEAEKAVTEWIIRRADYVRSEDAEVPLEVGGRPVVGSTAVVRFAGRDGARVIPPTDAGWRRFLELVEDRRRAVARGAKDWPAFESLAAVATAWWGRSLRAGR